MLGREPPKQLLSAPVGMPTAGVAQERGDRGIDLVGAMVRRSASIGEPTTPFLFEPRHPLVARLPGHAVALAELRLLVARFAPLVYKPRSFVHGHSLQPGHRST